MKSYVQQQNGFIAAIHCRSCGQRICGKGKYRDERSDWNGIENGMEICPECASINSGQPKRGRKKMGMGRPKEDHHFTPRQREWTDELSDTSFFEFFLPRTCCSYRSG